MGLRVFARPAPGDPSEPPRWFGTEERKLAQAHRQQQLALDAHQAVRATLRHQVQLARPEVAAKDVWHRVNRVNRVNRVRQDAGERQAWPAWPAWQARQAWQAWPAWQRRRTVVARVYARIRWRRGTCTHQEGPRLVKQYDLLAVEAPSVQSMGAHHPLAQQHSQRMHDAAWTPFSSLLAGKAAWARRQFVTVNPA